jgi:hypothetical protein
MNFLITNSDRTRPEMSTTFSLKQGFMALVVMIFLCGLNFPSLFAQGDMRFIGKTTKDGKPLAGAVVTVLMDGHNFTSITTGRLGNFKFDLDMGHQYRMNFSSSGCIDMYMLLDLRVPPDKMSMFPAYKIEVPFFEPGNKSVHVDLYKDQPFAKVVYDGKGGFEDDPTYKFVEKVVIDPAEEARKQAAIAAAAEQKVKDEADRKAREQILLEEARKAKALSEQKALEEAVARAKDEESRKKAEEALSAKKEETMESDAMRLEKEKQEKAIMEKKNRGIKSQYENELLKMVAESEKKANLQKYNNMKNESEANSVIQSMRRNAELKAATEALRRQEKEKEERTLINKQLKVTQVKRLIEAAALTEKIIRISTSPNKDPQTYTHESIPNIVVSVTEGVLSDIRTTLISSGEFKVTYKKENYIWGSTYYYRDGKEIDEKNYTTELANYLKK